jgi:hypothetical protein
MARRSTRLLRLRLEAERLDARACASLFADDGRLIDHNGRQSRGHPELVAHFGEAFAAIRGLAIAGPPIQWSPEVSEVEFLETRVRLTRTDGAVVRLRLAVVARVGEEGIREARLFVGFRPDGPLTSWWSSQ